MECFSSIDHSAAAGRVRWYRVVSATEGLYHLDPVLGSVVNAIVIYFEIALRYPPLFVPALSQRCGLLALAERCGCFSPCNHLAAGLAEV